MPRKDRFYKDPNEVLDYKVDWTDYLGASNIASSVWTHSLTEFSPGNDNKTATVYLGGGTLGSSYEVTNEITTNDIPARVAVRSFVIRIVDK